VLTPTGKISRYFFGVQYDAKDVRLGLVEASANKIGSPTDKLLLYCFHYDPLTGKYNVAVMNLIRLFGVLTVIAMAVGIVVMLRREKSAKPEAPSPV
jgi:protein SCO1/2